MATRKKPYSKGTAILDATLTVLTCGFWTFCVMPFREWYMFFGPR